MPEPISPPVPSLEPPPYWTPKEAERRYFVPAWGDGYFSVNDRGHVAVRPAWDSRLSIDLHDVAVQLRQMGVKFPILIRFQDLLHNRVVHLNEAFRTAIAETGYRGAYRGVFPIKVNQLREVVEEILEAGQPYGYGLECGSKSELIAALPYLESDEMLLICNGCKDDVMMRLMLEGQRLGKAIVPVLERYAEFGLLQRMSRQLGHDARFGVRIRLSTYGAGLWSESGGENSKFGLSLREVLTLADTLLREGQHGALRLLHFHLGSQIADRENVQQAVQEVARIYAQLYRRGLEIAYLDIGGGLGISYDGGNLLASGGINYTLEAYARAAVETLAATCNEEGVPHPIIVSESGRAVTAYHSVLITEVLGTRTKQMQPPEQAETGTHPLLEAFEMVYKEAQELTQHSAPSAFQEAYQRAEALRLEGTDRFRAGQLSLEQKAAAEQAYWAIGHALLMPLRHRPAGTLPDDLAALDAQFVDQYLCDFSVFRSFIDHWAIGQRFPIMPIHRLDEIPTRRGILVDLTCDSDGKVADFVVPAGEKHFLELHPHRAAEPYYLGFFLMGAYQDIMGDMHNLFGRVTEAHVYVDEDEPGNF